jgi:hypothetical protein
MSLILAGGLIGGAYLLRHKRSYRSELNKANYE